MNVLEVRELRKSFKRDFMAKRSEVLKGVSFSLHGGSITAFLGGNGAGKTTTIKCVLSLLRADSGDVRFFGGEKLTNSIRSRIGFLPERAYFYEYLTGLEFLQFYGELSGKWKAVEVRERANRLLDRIGLKDAKDRRLRKYSKGMLQKIGVAQAIIHEPELVILDEPMSGLDPDGRFAVSEIIQDVAKRGAAVFFSSHLINDAEKLCDRVIMMKDGLTLYEGSLVSLLQQTQQGFNLRLMKGGADQVRSVPTERELQSELRRALDAGESIVEVMPLRMTLEEIFVSRALRN